MNLYSFVGTVSFLLTLFVFIHILVLSEKNPLTRAFICFNGLMLGVSAMLMLYLVDISMELHIPILKVHSFMWNMLGLSFLFFVYRFVSKKLDTTFKVIGIVAFTANLVFLISDKSDVKSVFTRWGFVYELTAPFFAALVITVIIPVIYSFVILDRYLKEERGELLKQQICTIKLGMLVSAGYLILMAFLLPYVMKNIEIVYLAFLTPGVFILFLFIALQKNSYLSVNIGLLRTLSKRLFENVEEGVIIIDGENNLFHANNAAYLINLDIDKIIETVQDANPLEKSRGDFSGVNVNIDNGRGETKRIIASGSVIKESGHIFGRIIFLRDITSIYITENLLLESTERYKRIIDAITDYVFTVTMKDGNIFDVRHNAASEAITGYKPEDFENEKSLWDKIIHKKDRAFVLEQTKKMVNGEMVSQFEHRVVTKTNSVKWVRNTFVPFYSVSGEIVSYDNIISDITERKLAEEALKESEGKFRNFSEQSLVAILIVQKGTVKYINHTVVEVLEIDYKNIMAWELDDFKLIVHPENNRYYKEVLDLVAKGDFDSNVNIPLKIVTGAGNVKWIELYFKNIYMKGKKAIMVVGTDITERKNAEVKLVESLSEKDILLKEIHHRVKNNLQIISSLLALQIRYIKDSADIAIFRDSQNRVKSMALVHEKLYQSSDFGKILFRDYVKNLCSHLNHSYYNRGCIILFLYEIDDISIDIQYAIPCGLILNELISNSIKYAFTDGKGEIKIGLKFRSDNNFELCISDNGIGLPEDFSIESTHTLGMQLVKSLISQLHGEYNIESAKNKGVSFTIVFPAN